MLSLQLGSYHGLELSLDADTASALVMTVFNFFCIHKKENFMAKVKMFGASFLRV